MAQDVLVLVEHSGGKVDSITFQLLAAGRRLAAAQNARLVALAIGHELTAISAALQDCGADTVILVDDPALALASGEIQAGVIAEAAQKIRPRFLLIGYSLIGMELTPAVATKLSMNAWTNCVDVKVAHGAITITRPVFDSTMHQRVALDDHETAVIALQKGSFAPMEPASKKPSVESVSVDIKSIRSHSRVLGIVEAPTGDVDITKAEIVVSAGRGIGSQDKISVIAELADALGGVLACSRPVVDVGWLPRERQVGASGRTVTPKIYVACGISGAIQHLTGMRDSHRIIAINKDPNAPIFQVAHIGVVGDLFEIVPALTKAAKEAKAGGA